MKQENKRNILLKQKETLHEDSLSLCAKNSEKVDDVLGREDYLPNVKSQMIVRCCPT